MNDSHLSTALAVERQLSSAADRNSAPVDVGQLPTKRTVVDFGSQLIAVGHPIDLRPDSTLLAKALSLANLTLLSISACRMVLSKRLGTAP